MTQMIGNQACPIDALRRSSIYIYIYGTYVNLALLCPRIKWRQSGTVLRYSPQRIK